MFYIIEKQDLVDLLSGKKKIEDIVNYKNKLILAWIGEDVISYINLKKEELKDEENLSPVEQKLMQLKENDIKEIIDIAKEYIQEDFSISDIVYSIIDASIEDYIKENLTK